MKKALVAAIGVTTLVVMTGCRHRKVVVTTQPPPPPRLTEHPAIPHATMADIPFISMPEPPNVVLGGAVEPAPTRHEAPPEQATQPTAATNAQEDAKRTASEGEEPPTTTPIGQLSAAPNTRGLPSSKSIGNEIQWIQGQLKNIHHALDAKQQRTASEIQTFLAKATNALQAGDLDGAHTLTVKARVLLSEIQ